MVIWITRQAEQGLLITEYFSPDEIEEGLRGLEQYDEFSLGEEVKVELTARWEEVKQFFEDLQQLTDMVRSLDFSKGSPADKVVRRMIDNKLVKD